MLSKKLENLKNFFLRQKKIQNQKSKRLKPNDLKSNN